MNLILLIRKHILTILFAALLIIFSGCLKSKRPGIPDEVQQSLNNAGIRKPGLMKVLLTYQQHQDSLKLKSAYYLIQNLENNYTIKMSLRDTSENIIDIDIDKFSNYAAIQEYKDSIEIELGGISYKADSIWLDVDTINSEFLIEHIDNAYDCWQNSNWDSKVDFNTYCNYILPYRLANEEIELSNKHFQNKYNHLISNNIIETSTILNSYINRLISYDERLMVNPNSQKINVTEESGKGNLIDINIYKIKALRSMGIAAALDYTPYYVDSTLGFYSTTVILPNNRKLILTNSSEHTTPYPQGKVAKVYRRSHNNDPVSLFSIKNRKTHTPPFLGNYNYLDVTDEYIHTANVSIDFTDTTQFVYLAVYNENEWKPIEWAKPGNDGKAHFFNMGTEINYKPVIISDKEVVSIGDEFFLSIDGDKIRKEY